MRFLVRCVTLALPLALVGCSTDPREAKINSVLQYVDQAATEISNVKDAVDKATQKAANKKLNAQEVKAAQDAIDNLKGVSRKMQETRGEIDQLPTTPERQKELQEQFRKRLSGALARVEEERLLLQKSLQAAEAVDADGVKELRSKLTEVEGNFEMLARQR